MVSENLREYFLVTRLVAEQKRGDVGTEFYHNILYISFTLLINRKSAKELWEMFVTVKGFFKFLFEHLELRVITTPFEKEF